MKKIFLLALPLLFAYSFTGCSEFLDENPKSLMPEEEAYVSATLTYVNTVAAIYSALDNNFYGSTDNIHALQEFSSDAWILPGRQEDWVDGGKWQSLFLHNYGASFDMVRTVWESLYSIIGKCNNSIDKLDVLIKAGGEDYLQDYQYELRTLRAMMYLQLIDLYGRVPIVTSSTAKVADIEQSPRSKVFHFIITELDECIPHLKSGKSQNFGLYYGRVTRAIGYMTMAKVAINSPIFNNDNWTDGKLIGGINAVAPNVNAAGKDILISLDGEERNAWETVIYCQQQIEDEGYGLQPDFSANFSKTNDASIENIWTQPSDGTTYKIWDANTTRSLNPSHATAYGLQGWNGASSTVEQMLVFGYKIPEEQDASYNPDPRLDLTFFHGPVSVNGEPVEWKEGIPLEYHPLDIVVDFPPEMDQQMKMAGARLKKYEIDNTTTDNYNQNNDKVLWRYADALLLAAEAKVRLEQNGDAEVNQVRDRVNAGAKTDVTLKDILDERLLELSYEGMRRQDQIRFGTYTEPTADRKKGVAHNTMTGDYVEDITGYTTVYPIPTSVMQLNTKLTQNPGY